MLLDFDPVKTWLRYGISDLYFGYANQSNDVYHYGTFFFIMAAEKHLKAVLIESRKDEYESVGSLEGKRNAVDKIARSYSHRFDLMVEQVAKVYEQHTGKTFLEPEVFGYPLATVVKTMQEGYMETRYPVVAPASRRYPLGKGDDLYHEPLGSSFFTDFTKTICRRCWYFLVAKGLDHAGVFSYIEERYGESRMFGAFKTTYLDGLPTKL